ncbi:MAG: DUF6261 family protein [Tannerellaceae bacterium]|jgi:hypothetical protein|nr:DUF6261 family protein [Tannerellaceae bacterium]
MKVLRITLNNLHNQEWFEFFTDFEEGVDHFGSSNIGLEKLYDKFTPLRRKADELLVVLRKSTYTEELEAADKKRDELFRGFHSIAKGSQAQPDAAKQKAAKQLFNLLEGHRKFVLSGNNAAESGALYNLLQDLKGDYAPAVTLLALTDWVTAIEAAEKEFLAIRAERTGESVAKPKEDLRQLRAQIDVLYTAMANVLDAQLLADGLGGNVAIDPGDLDDEIHIDGEDESHDLHGNIPYNFVIAWNETVKKYHAILANRATRRANKKETNEPEA